MENNAKFSFINQLDFFKLLDMRHVSYISNQSELVSYTKGSIVFNSGDKVKYVYFIKKGSIKVGFVTCKDKTILREIVFENEMFGEHIFNQNCERKHYVECMSDTEILRVPVAYFKSLLSNYPILCHEMSKIYIKKLSHLETRMNNYVFKKAQNRIYLFLKGMAKTKGIKIGIDEILVNLGLSHRELAYITDTSRQTVARVLNELKRQNVIHFSTRKPHKILVRDMQFLT